MDDINRTAKKIHWINILLCVSLLTTGGILSFSSKKEMISETENRQLAGFPAFSDSSFWAGNYFKNLDDYYSDNFPFRENWMIVSDRFRDELGFRSSQIKIYEPVKNKIAKKSDTLVIATVSDDPLPDDMTTGEIKNRLFVFKNRAFELFRGEPAMGKYYATVINSYSRLLSPGIRIYNLIIPVALEFEITQKYANYQKPNGTAIENIYNNEDSAINKVRIIDELRAHRNEYIYFGTDHHWTSLGAYYAYREFCASAGLTPVSLDTVDSKVKPAFLGSLYRITRDADLKNHPDSVRYYLFKDSMKFSIGDTATGRWYKSNMYRQSASGGESYSVFLRGDLPIVKMETQHKNGRKIAVVKESFGNAFSCFLINNYEKIIIVDQRYYTGDFIGMLKKEDINELLFINNIFAAYTLFQIEKIKGLKKNGADIIN